MSKLLVKEYPVMFQPSFAQELGVNGAILLQQIHYWLQTCSTTKDGSKWVYNTYKDWHEQLPFWSEATIKRALRLLEKEGYIFTANFNKFRMDQTKWYTINYAKINEWEKAALIDHVTIQPDLLDDTDCPIEGCRLDKAIPEITTETTKDIYNIPYSEVIEYLNSKTNAAYKPSTKKTQNLIKARWKEGFTLPDFKKVIDIKTAEWQHDAYWNKYLRPETLFGTKFESYVNQQPKKRQWREEDFNLNEEE
ncbi:conserved phage C-terminal domain-containing protein [Lederbergia lenta]|uniref:Phage replication protein n=1 Tax=Lederbergia lenta TaxID=1467 RepID=A0A2X4WIV8_LEDLE|nr:conserved phage C-terminal domain-containing protein [Lederbergia lenta]MEC2323143.1 conserved phage C-terminal domain-containing protein [Lederbergia lenta]SQI62809.1 Phage replication protein [Lederbergia lenta]